MGSTMFNLRATWAVIQVVLVAFVICAWITASQQSQGICESSGEDSANVPVVHTVSHTGGKSFVLVWKSLLAVALSIVGTAILQKPRGPFSVGFFFGVTGLMANIMLGVSVSSADHILRRFGDRGTCLNCRSVDEAMAVFAVLLFLLYTVFSGQLWLAKDYLGGAEMYDDDNDCEPLEQELPDMTSSGQGQVARDSVAQL